MVNVHQITAAERVDAERMQLILKDYSEKLPVSRNFTHLFRGKSASCVTVCLLQQ
jgi:DNA-binding LytR/AlgR family response regulator